MEHAIEVLEKAESVLYQRIRNMRDGKPRWVAQDKLNQLRSAITLIRVSK